jgi:hypothetical protein
VLKRLTANSLLVILIASLLAPLAVCFEQSSVPARCRRDGKHHCMAGMSGIVRKAGALSLEALTVSLMNLTIVLKQT